MSGAGGAAGKSLPPIRDIINALRRAAGAIVQVAGVVDRVGSAADVVAPSDLGEMLEGVRELQEAVNQLATDELEDDLRTEAIARDLGELGSEMRGLRELPREVAELRANVRDLVHQLRVQSERLAVLEAAAARHGAEAAG